MYEQLEIHYEGQTEFVATDQQVKNPCGYSSLVRRAWKPVPTCGFRLARSIPIPASGCLQTLLSRGVRAWW